MGSKKTSGYRIDVGEIEFVARHPKDHTLPYVKAVREACYRRWLRYAGRDKLNIRISLRSLDYAIKNWKFEDRDGKLVPVGPSMQRDQDSGVVGEC